MQFLKNHPFAVEAYFENSLVLTFAVPKEQLTDYIPESLALDTFQDKWAFIAVAMVQTKALRPKGFPRFLGQDFFLIGYRIFVRYTNRVGKRLRGLYILKSETDSRMMARLGNVFTHYNYSTTDILTQLSESEKTICSTQSQFEITIEQTGKEASIPNGSPFSNWKEARRFAGPLPHTFTYNKKAKSVLIIRGARQNWKPKAVQVKHFSFAFLDGFQLEDIVLANAFEIKDVPYFWKKGSIEKWK